MVLAWPYLALRNRLRTQRFARLAAGARKEPATILEDRLVVGELSLPFAQIRAARALVHDHYSMASGLDEELLLVMEHPGGRLVLCGYHLWSAHEALVARGLLPPTPEPGGMSNNLALSLSGLAWVALALLAILVASALL